MSNQLARFNCLSQDAGVKLISCLPALDETSFHINVLVGNRAKSLDLGGTTVSGNHPKGRSSGGDENCDHRDNHLVLILSCSVVIKLEL